MQIVRRVPYIVVSAHIDFLKLSILGSSEVLAHFDGDTYSERTDSKSCCSENERK